MYALTLAMAVDHLAEGIRVNCVSPGTVDTPWVWRLLENAEDPAAASAALRARQSLGRLVSADEAAAAVVCLASPAAGAVTGTDLRIDGGLPGLRLPSRRQDLGSAGSGVAGSALGRAEQGAPEGMMSRMGRGCAWRERPK